MEQQMNTILLLLIFTGLVGMLLVIFFMLDRLNELHRNADIPKGQIDPAGAFGGLTGKNLWDAMIGIPMPGWDQKKIAALRPRYELVLQKHLELLFEDGKLDGREGLSMPVRCDRKVPTLRGDIDSWMPHEFASGVYRAGYALATSAEGDTELVQRQLDMLGQAIFSATGLPPHPLSSILMPQLERLTNAGEDDALATDEAATEPEAGHDNAQPALPAPDAPDTLATPDTLAIDIPPVQEPVEQVADEAASAETVETTDNNKDSEKRQEVAAPGSV
jgi:hypothetical protein